MPTPDLVPVMHVSSRSPLLGVMVAGIVSVPVWALLAVAVNYMN